EAPRADGVTPAVARERPLELREVLLAPDEVLAPDIAPADVHAVRREAGPFECCVRGCSAGDHVLEARGPGRPAAVERVQLRPEDVHAFGGSGRPAGEQRECREPDPEA